MIKEKSMPTTCCTGSPTNQAPGEQRVKQRRNLIECMSMYYGDEKWMDLTPIHIAEYTVALAQ
jgi:hypothetical protein